MSWSNPIAKTFDNREVKLFGGGIVEENTILQTTYNTFQIKSKDKKEITK